MVKRVGATILALFLWGATVFGGTLYGWWRRPLAPAGDVGAFMRAATTLAKQENSGNTALVLLKRGGVVDEYYSSSADSVDANTVFATGSLSKWIAAHAVMKLVEDGRLDLDRPVDDYLSRWHVRAGSFDARGVTARRLLSHTAGFTDDLGFGDYRRDETLPSLERTLAAPRASRGGTVAAVSVGLAPGTQFRYSGGGYAVLELLVEEISGERFEAFVQRTLLAPLGMQRSGFADLASVTNSAKSYHSTGRPAPIYRYASNAATGFTTSAHDMVTWVAAELSEARDRPLAPQTLAQMRATEARSMGVGIWGLGTILYAPTSSGDMVFGHDGVNDPAISATVRINPSTQDAIIVLATGSKTLASRLGSEWVFWQTGVPDALTIPSELERAVPIASAGAAGILFFAAWSGWRARRRRAADAVGSIA